MVAFPKGLLLFGGFNFKHLLTEDTFNIPKIKFSKKIQEGDDALINIFTDIWIFEFKNMSWYKPIIGGKFPRKSFNYSLQLVPANMNFKCVFVSSSMKKNKIYELYSSGGLIR